MLEHMNSHEVYTTKETHNDNAHMILERALPQASHDAHYAYSPHTHRFYTGSGPLQNARTQTSRSALATESISESKPLQLLILEQLDLSGLEGGL